MTDGRGALLVTVRTVGKAAAAVVVGYLTSFNIVVLGSTGLERYRGRGITSYVVVASLGVVAPLMALALAVYRGRSLRKSAPQVFDRCVVNLLIVALATLPLTVVVIAL